MTDRLRQPGSSRTDGVLLASGGDIMKSGIALAERRAALLAHLDKR